MLAVNTFAQNTRTFSGTIFTQQFELVPNITIEIQTFDGKLTATSDAEGRFSLQVPAESLAVQFYGNNIEPITRIFAATDKIEDIR